MSLYEEPAMDAEQTAILEAALARVDDRYKAALAQLPLDEYRVTRARFASARYLMTTMALRMQIAHKLSDGSYSALLLALSQELAIAALQSYPTQDEKVRDRVLFKHNLATFARAVRASLIPEAPKPSSLVDANGKRLNIKKGH